MSEMPIYTNDEGEDYVLIDTTEIDKLNEEIKDLKSAIEFLELKETLHLRLIAGGNDELAKRGHRIDELKERNEFLEKELKYWADQARGGFDE
jgi:chromosome segregation ATPase